MFLVQDFSHIHTFKGHEHKVMAIVYADEEVPLCISGDNGGGICVWCISVPLNQEPLKKWNEQKDWLYSGIHAMAVSGNYLYTGSGDKTIKAWSLKVAILKYYLSHDLLHLNLHDHYTNYVHNLEFCYLPLAGYHLVMCNGWS